MACVNTMKQGCVWRALLASKVSQTQPLRTTVVVRRKHPVPLVPIDMPIDSRKMKEKHYIYEVVRRDNDIAAPDIQCLLTRHVDGLGTKGQLIAVKRKVFRRKLLPTGAAVYPSPENLAEFGTDEAVSISTAAKTQHALQTFRLLSGMNLPVRMNPFTTWTLTPENIQVAFRQTGIYIENADTITLPEEPVTNEHNEQEHFQVKVKINGLDQATVNCYMMPFTADVSKRAEIPHVEKLPLFRRSSEVEKELLEQGIYHGST